MAMKNTDLFVWKIAENGIYVSYIQYIPFRWLPIHHPVANHSWFPVNWKRKISNFNLLLINGVILLFL